MPTPRRHHVGRILVSAILALSTVVVASHSPALAQTACPVSASDQAIDAEEQELLTLINNYRAANGRNALSLSTAATRAAAWFSRDMASKNYTPPDHVDSNGRTIDQRLTWCGVTWTNFAEAIYWGSPDAQAAFDWWRNSPTHNAIMLSPQVTHAGIARAFDASSTFDWYWTLDLTAGEPTPPPQPVLAGATFYSDGTSSRTGPSGARVSAFATSAETGFAYKLVSGRSAPGTTAPCTADVVPITAAVKFATNQGVLAQTAGTLNRPAGQWQICFLAEGNETVTGAATYTVTA